MVADSPSSSTSSPIDLTGSNWVARAFALLATIVGAWLVWSLFVVNVEFDDGYATIINSQYFLGISHDYIWSRAPMLAWMLMPAEWAATALGLHPLDVRPHHLLMATVHFAYFWAVWRLLRHRFGASLPVLVAFAAAIPTVVYFCYAAFISSDLFPGLIALTMLLLADRYATERTLGTWLTLVVLGAAAALVKHMYGAIWFAVLVAHACLAVVGPKRDWMLLIQLAVGAAVSATIFWIVFALVLADSFPNAGLLMRPLQEMRAVVANFQQEGPIASIFYQWVYFKNLSNYGILAMSLVLPGIVIGWRSGDRLLRSIAIAWIVLFAVMQSVSFKEVRYLAYLAPLTAFLVVPAVVQLLRWNRWYGLPIAVVLAMDLGFSAREAARLASPFYQDQVQEFLAVLPLASDLTAPIITTRYLSFVSPDRYAFFGDRYHRIINLNHEQIRLLYGYPKDMVIPFPNVRALTTGAFAPGSVLLYVNDVAARVPPFREDNRTSLQEYFVQLVAVAETLNLRLDGDHYRSGVTSREPLLLLGAAGVDAEPLTAFDRFPAAKTIALQGLALAPEQLSVLAFRIHAMCDLSGCRRF